MQPEPPTEPTTRLPDADETRVLRPSSVELEPTVAEDGALLDPDPLAPQPTEAADEGSGPVGGRDGATLGVANAPGALASDTIALIESERRFTVRQLLGAGAMGVVYEAHDAKRDEIVALKVMSRVDPTALYRFKQEFRTLADLSHPNLLDLYELVGAGDRWFFTMELIRGVDFLSFVRDGSPDSEASTVEGPVPTLDPPPAPSRQGPCRLEPEQLDRLRPALAQLARGVAALHEANKLHRDIKPTNVLVTREGRVVLLDFGLAIEVEGPAARGADDESIVGTIGYMAPEQAAGRLTTRASDWYSVGVMLFEALTGRRPFEGKPIDVLQRKRHHDAPAPSSLVEGVPDDLDALCVALLRRDPAARPSGADILARLAVESATATAWRLGASPSLPLVGRERHRAILESSYEDMKQGQAVLLGVSGRSGAGKSALVQSFLDDLAEGGEAVVLTGRCYERESVPYKALDSLVDSLSRHLLGLPQLEVEALLPRDIGPLARIFPVLRRVEAVVATPRLAVVPPDLPELRRRAFAALRELLARMGDRRPLVLAIDDLQWGDVDSAALLADLIRPPDPPALLLLGTYRSEDAATSTFLQTLFQLRDSAAADVRELAVEALSHDEARDLALALLGRGDAIGPAEEIARESGGNPYFVYELVHDYHANAGERPFAGGASTLDEVLWRRVEGLPDEARRLLEVVAISGRPLRQAVACAAAELASECRTALTLLRTGRLIRVRGLDDPDEIESYHDRIRESVVAHLPAEAQVDHHRRLARTLLATGQADPEVLAVHCRCAGQPEHASLCYAQAADKAAEALAFDHAADLYRLALELRPTAGAEARALLTKRAAALANAGRGAEAASLYRDAAQGAEPAESLELRRRAALHWLTSGRLDAGQATLAEVLRDVGLTLPATPRAAIGSLLWWRLRSRLRGLAFHERRADEIPAHELTRIDVCWSAVAGLGVVDPIRAAAFQARSLNLALRAGEPFRLTRALAVEASLLSSAGRAKAHRAGLLIGAAEAIAPRVDHPYAQAMVAFGKAMLAYMVGRWRESLEHCDRAAAIFRDHCTGVVWELDTMNAFALWCLLYLGEMAELARRWPALLKQAQDRGDLYAVTNLSTYILSGVRLAADDPETAEREVEQAMQRWSFPGFYLQNHGGVHGRVHIHLYKGEGAAAWEFLRSQESAYAGSMLLRRLQKVRVDVQFLRARGALAAAREVADPRPLLLAAEREARGLERERVPWAEALACLVRAGLAAGRGDRAGVVTRLVEAAERLDAVDMRLLAAVARRRRGEWLGGEVGRALVAEADAWMLGQQVRNPARMAELYAPGLSGPGS